MNRILVHSRLIGGLLLSGCGIYSFSGSSLPAHLTTVSVPLMEDNTAEYGISQQLTDLLIQAITDDNTLKIASPGSGDSVLRGTILQVQERAGQYDQNEQASDFRITVTVQFVFEDLKKRSVLWEGQVSQWGVFDPGNRDQGITEALEKISQEVLNRIVSDW